MVTTFLQACLSAIIFVQLLIKKVCIDITFMQIQQKFEVELKLSAIFRID